MADTDLNRLTENLADRKLAYLTTVDAESRVHTVPVTPQFSAGVVRIGSIGGTTTRANLAQNRHVSVLWPPSKDGDYTVITDGRADVSGADGGRINVQLAPESAILIRLATPQAPSTTACEHECVNLMLPVRA